MPQRDATTFRVTINGEFVSHANVLRVERSAGGKRLDYAVIQIDRSRILNGTFLGNEIIGSQLGQEVEIAIMLPNRMETIHWGVIEQVEPYIGADGETLRVVSRVSPSLFGRTLWGQRHYNPIEETHGNGGAYPLADMDVVFNPEIDGRVRPNMRTYPLSPAGYNIFVDPLCALTTPARVFQQLQDGDPQYWTLAHAVAYLCGECNPFGAYIDNPTHQEVQAIVGAGNDQQTLLRNVRVPTGVYLPDVLDNLLEPFGYTWCVDTFGEGQRKIRVVKLGVGVPRSVRLQIPNTAFDRRLTNLVTLDMAVSDAERINQVRVRGSRKVVEATFELVPAWRDDQDKYGIESDSDLPPLDDPEWRKKPELHRVWRDWVLNEAGDYRNTRKEVKKTLDLNCLMQTGKSEINSGESRFVLPRRRRFLPSITLGGDYKPAGPVQGVLVEYLDYYDRESWRPIRPEEDPSWACQLLENECGIRFTGAMTPDEPMSQHAEGTTPKIRVTAAIELDTPLEVVAPNNTGTPTREMVLDMPTRFQHRYLYDESGGQQDRIKRSIWHDNPEISSLLATSEVDDSEAMLLFAFAVRDAFNLSDVAGTLTLEGVDDLVGYHVGDVITKVEGRELRFGAESSRYPQCLGISYDAQQQRTILTLSTFRNIDGFVGQIISDTRQRGARDAIT